VKRQGWSLWTILKRCYARGEKIGRGTQAVGKGGEVSGVYADRRRGAGKVSNRGSKGVVAWAKWVFLRKASKEARGGCAWGEAERASSGDGGGRGCEGRGKEEGGW